MNTDFLAAVQQQYISAYAAYSNTQKALELKMGKIQMQMERLDKRIEKHRHTYPKWIEFLMRPVIDEIEDKLIGWKCEDKEYIPLGLGCRVSVFFHRSGEAPRDDGNGRDYIYIVLLPGNLDKGELLFETGEKHGLFDSNTIGEVNGFNNVCKKLESIDEAVTFLKNQINL